MECTVNQPVLLSGIMELLVREMSEKKVMAILVDSNYLCSFINSNGGAFLWMI
jgi:hypothetical protein